jgi:protein SCO1/2
VTHPFTPTRIASSRALSRAAVAFAWIAGVLFTTQARAQLLLPEEPEIARSAGVTEKLGEEVPLDLVLDAWDNRRINVGHMFGQGHKPVVLALVYYDCPIVCSLVLNRLSDAIDALENYDVGSDFNVMVVSFDPTEGPADAAQWRAAALAGYDRGVTPEVEAGWGFYTGSAAVVRPLSDSVGFAYSRMPNGEFAHPTVFMVLTAEGRVSSYVHGFNYTSRDLKLALLEASEGKIAKSIGDWLIHKCYRYDPAAGAYTLQAMALMRFAGVVSIIGVGGLILALFIGERLRRELRARSASSNSPEQITAHQLSATTAGAAR